MDLDRLCRWQRINVVGTSGSGKSTFARQLSEVLNLPCYEMDRLHWKPDWQSSSDEEHIEFIRLTSPKSVSRFLSGVQKAYHQQSRH